MITELCLTRHMRLEFYGLLLATSYMLGSAQKSYGQQPSPDALPILSRVGEVRRLTPEQARKGYPLHLRVVVTYFDALEPTMFVEDATGGIWVDWPRTVTARDCPLRSQRFFSN
jgi:hypothetical protein